MLMRCLWGWVGRADQRERKMGRREETEGRGRAQGRGRAHGRLLAGGVMHWDPGGIGVSKAQVEMTSRQLDVPAQSSEARSELEARP